jgi:hypothetical protein
MRSESLFYFQINPLLTKIDKLRKAGRECELHFLPFKGKNRLIFAPAPTAEKMTPLLHK